MDKETRLITLFLQKFKEVYEKRTGNTFHPRHVILLFQNDMKSRDITWLSWHQWFNELNFTISHDHNLLEVLIGNFVHIALAQEESKNISMLTKRDWKKVEKIIKIAKTIKVYPKGIKRRGKK